MSIIQSIGTAIQFEPHPPGVARPGTLSSGYSNNAALYTQGAGGPQRMLLSEQWGFSVLDLSNKTNPTALVYEYLVDQGIVITGDGQSYIGPVDVSPDGQRAVLSMANSPGDVWGTLFLVANGNTFSVRDNIAFPRVSSVVKQYGSRYIAYTLSINGLYATDITNLSGSNSAVQGGSSLTPDTISADPSWGGQGIIRLHGNYLVYHTNVVSGADPGGVRIVDISNPGSPGSIGINFKTAFIPNSLPYYEGKWCNTFATPVPYFDQTLSKLFVLVPLFDHVTTPFGQSRPSDSWGLITATQDENGLFTVTPVGSIFKLPVAMGLGWSAYPQSSLVFSKGNKVTILMGMTRRYPLTSSQGFYGITADAWGTDTEFLTVDAGAMAAVRASYLDDTDSAIQLYSPTGSSAYVTQFTFNSVATPPDPPTVGSLLSGPTVFEPVPPGAPRPSSLNELPSMESYAYTYQGRKSLLFKEAFGYQVVDISAGSPSALGFADLRTSPTNPGPLVGAGDYHSTVAAAAVSEDGERAIFCGTTSQRGVNTYQTLACSPKGNGWEFTPNGDINSLANANWHIQKLGNSYYAYAVGPNVQVANLTSLPGLAAKNIHVDVATALAAPATTSYSGLHGHWLIYKGDDRSIYLVNLSVPLPAYNLAAKKITPSDFGRSDSFASIGSSIDPNNPDIVYILAEFQTGVRYVLLKVLSGAVTPLGSVDTLVGESTAGVVPPPTFGINKEGILFAFMFSAHLNGADYVYTQYISPVAAFGTLSNNFLLGPPPAYVAGPTSIFPSTANSEVYAYSGFYWYKMGAKYTPDGVVPDAPTDVVATQTNSTTVALEWSEPANTGSSAITNYSVVTHNTANGDQSDPINVPSPELSVSIGGLETGVEYNFYVNAINITGKGATGASNLITLTGAGSGETGPTGPGPTGPGPGPTGPGPVNTVPGAPTALSGKTTSNSIEVSWITPTSDGGKALTGYIVSYKVFGNTPLKAPAGITNKTVLSALTANTTYLVKVAAKNDVGIGPFSQEKTFVTESYQEVYPLSSWPSFNGIGQVFSVEFANIPAQVNALTAISRDTTTTTLYNTPNEVYAAIDEVGKFTFRTAKRKKGLNTVDNYKNYYDPPGNTTVSSDLQNLTANLTVAGLGFITQPDAGFINEMLNYSARPGDVYTIYRKFQSYFTGPDIFTLDHGEGAKIEWRTNRETPGVTDPTLALMPGWTYEYTQTRPFLRFDTRNLTPSVVVTKAFLTFKKDPNCPIVDPEKITLKFIKVNNTVGDFDLTTSDYNNLEGTILAQLPLSDPALQAGNTVSLLIPDQSFIKPLGISKIAVICSLETGSLPSDWTQITFQECKLVLSIDLSTVTTPGEVSYVVVDPSDRAVTINWGAPIIDGGSAVISYTIRSAETGEAKQILAEALVTDYTYEWTGLTNDITYSFTLTANNIKGAGQGLIFHATPSSQTVLPSAVRNLYALPEDNKLVISWDPPLNSGSSPIDSYYLTNTNTSQFFAVDPINTSYELLGLLNGVTYTIVVTPKNSEGAGPTSTITATPTNGQTVPARPAIQDVYATEGTATVYWIPPANDGGDPIIGWVVTLDAPEIPGYLPVAFSVSDPTQTSFVINHISTGNVYTISVAAANSIGTGPAAFSDMFTVSSGVLTDGLLVDVDYNYIKFYEAPIDLNINSPQYLEYLYPEQDDFYAVKTPAYVQSGLDIEYPVAIGRSFRFLYFNVQVDTTGVDGTINTASRDYAIDLLSIDKIHTPPVNGGIDVISFDTWTLKELSDTFNAICNTSGIPLVAYPLAGQRISVKTDSEGQGVRISLTPEKVIPILSANNIVFGSNPFIADGYTELPVKNHVPTPEYDTINQKALVDSRTWTTVPNYDASRPSLYVEHFDTYLGTNYDLNLVTNIRPNGITISYYDKNNKIVILRDYLGDGRILYRNKASAGAGEPVSFTYPSDALYPSINPSDGVSSFGNIDYKTGKITGLVFPTFINADTGAIYPTFKPAMIIGKGITWPIYIPKDTSLFFTVNSEDKEFFIPKNTLVDEAGNVLPADETTYSAEDVSKILNAQDGFRLSGLVAGVTAGQLYVQNVGIDPVKNYPTNIGPTFTLTMTKNDGQFLNAAGEPRSSNRALFGITPIQYSPSKVYITYSYTTYDPSTFRHIWYQTPHFLLKSATPDAQFITKGHLNYLLNKLLLFRPAITTLDNIEFSPAFSERNFVNDKLTISRNPTGVDVEIPYIQVSPRPQVATSSNATVAAIRVINPDEQENTLLEAYTYDDGGVVIPN